MPYEGPPIKLRRTPGGGFKIQTQGGGIKLGGHNLAMAAGNNNGCYNNVQCQDANDERYSCVAPDGGPCSPGKSGCTCKCTDNSDPGWPCDETPTPTPTATATPTPTPTPTITPSVTFKTGAWCNVAEACDGKLYRTGGCSSGTFEEWTAADNSKTALDFSAGQTCGQINCPPEVTPECTPTPTRYGAWCTGLFHPCDSLWYTTGCSEGSLDSWMESNDSKTVQSFSEGSSCANLGCNIETTPVCTPTPTPPPTPTYANFINKDNILDVYGIN